MDKADKATAKFHGLWGSVCWELGCTMKLVFDRLVYVIFQYTNSFWQF